MKFAIGKFSIIIKTVFKWTMILLSGMIVVIIGYGIYVWYSFDTKTLPENYGKVSTQLYLGDGEQQPLIVILGGSSGGNQWANDGNAEIRKMFSDSGLATLAVGYFGMNGIPQNLDRIGIEGVHQAVLEAANHPQIDKSCIGLMGISRGSVLALLLAANYEDYKSVAAVVPGSCVFFAVNEVMNTPAYAHNGRPFPFISMTWKALPSFISGNYRDGFDILMKDSVKVKNAFIPIEDINGSILFMSAKNDEVWPSMEMSEAMMQRLEEKNFKFDYEHICLDGGHEEFIHHFSTLASFFNKKN